MSSQKIELVFVILHYKNIKDTLECIASIRKLKNKNYKIVVVDNCSGIKEDTLKLQKQADDLYVSEENLGFAKGNNKGIEIAKKYKPEFIAVINNDTTINQKDWIERIKKLYQKSEFDVFGPKIITKDGDSVNPFPAYKTLSEVNAAIKKSKKLISIYKSKPKRFALANYIKLKRIIKKPKRLQNSNEYLEDVSLHGCALIFSKKYYEKYEYCIYNETFLYHEEEFLEYRRKKDNLKFVYEPTIEIFHKEGSSLAFNYNANLYKKLIFREENIIKSLTLLKEIMEQNKGI